jgi:hypothetical protein
MQLRTKQVQVEYRGEQITCDKTVYGCDHCDFELHLDWMKEKMQQHLAEAYEQMKRTT